jgi:hypothetical protein
MSLNEIHDPVRELNEIRNQLSYMKRVGFFFGAGTSKSIGISDIGELTEKVESSLESKYKSAFKQIKACIPEDECKFKNVEEILNQTRLIRQITYEKSDKSYEGIDGILAKELDAEICNKIYLNILDEERDADLSHTKKFFAWLNWLSRDFPKEIFTTNYDLILEKALESLMIPFFDGFVGSNEPFFLPESLEKESPPDNPPTSWIRLWKLHGSLGWFWKQDENGRQNRIIRLGEKAKFDGAENEIVIYPSREKYESSRKQPFISYFDRLKSLLNDGERLFIINGYSFSDEHVNAQLFDSIRKNNRLHVLGFLYSDSTLDNIVKNEQIFPNFSVFSPTKGIINGVLGGWIKKRNDPFVDQFWDDTNKSIKLGDFKELVRFFITSSGKKEKIENLVTADDE